MLIYNRNQQFYGFQLGGVAVDDVEGGDGDKTAKIN